jgi:hypothetical protein
MTTALINDKFSFFNLKFLLFLKNFFFLLRELDPFQNVRTNLTLRLDAK